MKASSQTQSKRLIGWLVSYAKDELGQAYEIREGRTLISTKKEQGSSITLEVKDMSAPHLAMRGTKEHQLFAQDIFSKAGSFIERSAKKGEVPIEGPVELAHGDWIRLGTETRFQVCLIEGIRR